MKKQIIAGWLGALCLATAVTAAAGPLDFWRSKGKDAELVKKVRDCEQVIKDLMQGTGKDIPKNMLKDAEAVVIFSDSVRAGLLVTGQFAQGVALVKTGFGDWSAPAFFRMSGVGVGLQIGGDVSDVVFVVTGKEGIGNLLESRFTMGADASAAAGQKGRQIKASTNSKTHMVAYGRSKGLFAGMSFDGAVIKQDSGANRKYYGKKLTAREILLEGKAMKTAEAADLISTLKKNS
jgi:lipid-binding SYLF domain-containing protein